MAGHIAIASGFGITHDDAVIVTHSPKSTAACMHRVSAKRPDPSLAWLETGY